MSVALRLPPVRHPPTRRRAVTKATGDPSTTAISGVLFVRYLRPRSVAAFAFVLLLGTAALGVTAAIVAWHLAVRWGIVEDAETLMVELGFETFEIRPDQLLDILLVVAAAGVVVGTILAVVAAILFNLVSWITGGIAFSTRERRAGDG